MWDQLLATHNGCFGIRYRLYPQRLEYEVPVRGGSDPAQTQIVTVSLDDVVSLRVRRDDQQRLTVCLHCAKQPKRTIAFRDDREGNFFLSRLSERCALLCPHLTAYGLSYSLDLRAAWRRTMRLFVSALLFLCASVVLFFLPLPIGVPIVCVAGTVVFFVLFFLQRRDYRDLLSVGQVFALDKDREEDLSASGAKELEQIAALDREDKTAAQAAWISETAAAAERCLPAKKDDTACALLGDLLLRRTGYTAPDENLVTQWNQAAQKAMDMAGRIVSASEHGAGGTTVFAESEKKWYAQLRFSSVRFEPMKQGMGAWVILDITRQPASDEGTCAKKENLSAGALDGWIRARVRFDGEDVAMGMLLLPPWGLAFGTKVTLRAPVLLPHPCDVQKTVVWTECGRLWAI